MEGETMKIPALTAMAALLTPPPLLAQGGGGGLVSVDLGIVILTIAVFGLVLWVLGKYAWKPILGALDAREAGVRNSIEQAAAMREEAQALLEEHREQLASSRKESQQIVADGRAAAERIRSELEEKARAEGDRILERARIEIQRERDRALESVREEAVDLALAAASSILSEKLTDERDRQLVAGYLKELRPDRAEA
ncbi:MAG: ATP synthase F0 subunit B [Gemmatimonadales bacterium]|nr:MAG: ATP synthase F0 subunit B [Gemmatimonadales bacterium]